MSTSDNTKVILVKESKKLGRSKDITTSDGKTFVTTTNNFRKEDDNNKVKRRTSLGIEN
jgi:hypothetical protein